MTLLLNSYNLYNKASYREDRQIFLSLQETCKQMKSEIRRLDGECRVEMEKRFGEGVSFADIDAFAVNRYSNLNGPKVDSRRWD